MIESATGKRYITQEALDYFQVNGSFAGNTPGECKEKYPELTGFTEYTDDQGNTSNIPRFKMTGSWNVEYTELSN
jgi:hypothetical protein